MIGVFVQDQEKLVDDVWNALSPQIKTEEERFNEAYQERQNKIIREIFN